MAKIHPSQGYLSHGDRLTFGDDVSTKIRTVAINVAGLRISLRTDRDETYLRTLADEINAYVDKLRQASPGAGLPQLMALISVQLLDRAKASESAISEGDARLHAHANRLTAILEAFDSGDLQG